MNKIFALNGLPISGKTLFGKLVAEQLKETQVSFLHTSSVDPVKQIIQPEDKWDPEFREREIYVALREIKRQIMTTDWDGVTKSDYWRGAMFAVKRKIHEFDPNFIHTWVLSKALQLKDPFFVFVDIREPENIEGFKRFCLDQAPEICVKSVLITSDLAIEFSNSSDSLEILEHDYDIRILNERGKFGDNKEMALNELRREAEKFVINFVLSETVAKEREH